MHTEKNISALIKSQFPRLYAEEGPLFIDFVTAYYEWLSEDGNVLDKTRSLPETLDIDETADEFVKHFQKQYLLGIPEDIKSDKRFLIKHILDIYRAKGTSRGYKLLFRLLFNEDIDVYLPSRDIFKTDDNTWVEPVYIEVNDVPYNKKIVGKSITGLSSGATAIVESYARQPLNGKIAHIHYLGNLLGTFTAGEKIVLTEEIDDVGELYAGLPKIAGSLAGLTNIYGGQNFSIGDNLQITSGNGEEGILRITETTSGSGSLFFAIEDGGSYFTTSPTVFITRTYDANTPRQGVGAGFDVDSIVNFEDVKYCTNLLMDWDNSATLSTYAANTIESTFTYVTESFGKIATLTNVDTGNNYVLPATIQVRDLLTSNPLVGTVTYAANSDVVLGTNTTFTTHFTAGDYIKLVADPATQLVIDTRIVKTVSNNTHMLLDDYPLNTSNNNLAEYHYMAPVIRSNFLALGTPNLLAANGSIRGENETISASPLAGAGIISGVVVKNSGFGYDNGEFVDLAVMGTIESVTVTNGGSGYANNDTVTFSGSAINPARAVVATDANGTITSVVMLFGGSGYKAKPSLTVVSAAGTGAVLDPVLSALQTTYKIRGEVVTSGMGKSIGFWTSTKSFLDSDKYLQDDYYYQEYSYEIQSSLSLERYASIMKKIFHLSGTEMFGKVFLSDTLGTSVSIVNEEISQE